MDSVYVNILNSRMKKRLTNHIQIQKIDTKWVGLWYNVVTSIVTDRPKTFLVYSLGKDLCSRL